MISTRRKFLETAALGAVGAAIMSKPALADIPSTQRQVPPQELGDRFDPWIEVEANALTNNVAEVRRLTANRPILAVIKNNAYGLDLTTAAALLEPMPEVAGFAVVKAEAAIALKETGVRKPVYLMALFSESLAPELARLGVRPCLYSDDALRLVEPMVRTVGEPIEVEIYLDTGMSRMGIPYHKALPWIESVVGSGKVRVGGVFTGFTEDPEFDKEQLRRFMSVTKQASDAGFPLGTLHAASSSAVFELPESHLDMVRPGMALYGGYPNDPALQREKASLRSAVRLKARVVRVERLRSGDSVSYGRNYMAQEPTWVATLPVGHTDGYPRAAVEGARILIGAKTYPVIGAVSASHAIVELGPETTVVVGDVATFLGPDAAEIDPNWLSAETGVSIYDIFMHLNPLLPRVVV
ncbi:MAG: alanine racemase [Gemmatimonadota bacterium]